MGIWTLHGAMVQIWSYDQLFRFHNDMDAWTKEKLLRDLQALEYLYEVLSSMEKNYFESMKRMEVLLPLEQVPNLIKETHPELSHFRNMFELAKHIHQHFLSLLVGPERKNWLGEAGNNIHALLLNLTFDQQHEQCLCLLEKVGEYLHDQITSQSSQRYEERWSSYVSIRFDPAQKMNELSERIISDLNMDNVYDLNSVFFQLPKKLNAFDLTMEGLFGQEWIVYLEDAHNIPRDYFDEKKAAIDFYEKEKKDFSFELDARFNSNEISDLLKRQLQERITSITEQNRLLHWSNILPNLSSLRDLQINCQKDMEKERKSILAALDSINPSMVEISSDQIDESITALRENWLHDVEKKTKTCIQQNKKLLDDLQNNSYTIPAIHTAIPFPDYHQYIFLSEIFERSHSFSSFVEQLKPSIQSEKIEASVIPMAPHAPDPSSMPGIHELDPGKLQSLLQYSRDMMRAQQSLVNQVLSSNRQLQEANEYRIEWKKFKEALTENQKMQDWLTSMDEWEILWQRETELLDLHFEDLLRYDELSKNLTEIVEWIPPELPLDWTSIQQADLATMYQSLFAVGGMLVEIQVVVSEATALSLSFLQTTIGQILAIGTIFVVILPEVLDLAKELLKWTLEGDPSTEPDQDNDSDKEHEDDQDDSKENEDQEDEDECPFEQELDSLNEYYEILSTLTPDMLHPNLYLYPLRGAQPRVFDKMVRYLNRCDTQGGFVKLPTGSGKTFLFVQAIRGLLRNSSARALIVTEKPDLVQQINDEFETFVPPGELSVGMYYGKEKDLSQRITITTYSSITKGPQNFPPSDYQILILDEVHKVVSIAGKRSDYFSQNWTNHLVMGFTATAVHDDGRNVIDMLPTEIDSINLLPAIEHYRGMLSSVESVIQYVPGINLSHALAQLKKNDPIDTTRGFNTSKLQEVMESQEALEAVIKTYGQLFEVGNHKGVVFSSGVTAAYLMAHLTNQLYPQDPPLAAWVGAIRNNKLITRKEIERARTLGIQPEFLSMTYNKRADILKDFRNPNGNIKILFNDSLFAEGLNVKDLDFVFLAGPTKNRMDIEQRGGRGVRWNELDPLKRVTIVDFVFANPVDETNGAVMQSIFPHILTQAHAHSGFRTYPKPEIAPTKYRQAFDAIEGVQTITDPAEIMNMAQRLLGKRKSLLSLENLRNQVTAQLGERAVSWKEELKELYNQQWLNERPAGWPLDPSSYYAPGGLGFAENQPKEQWISWENLFGKKDDKKEESETITLTQLRIEIGNRLKAIAYIEFDQLLKEIYQQYLLNNPETTWPMDPEIFYGLGGPGYQAANPQEQWTSWENLFDLDTERFMRYAELRDLMKRKYATIDTPHKYYQESLKQPRWSTNPWYTYWKKGWKGPKHGKTDNPAWIDFLPNKKDPPKHLPYNELKDLMAKEYKTIDTILSYETESSNHDDWPIAPYSTYCGKGWKGDCSGTIKDEGWPNFLPKWKHRFLTYEKLKSVIAEKFAAKLTTVRRYWIEAKNHEDWPSNPQQYYCERRGEELVRQWPGTCKDGVKDPGWKDLLPNLKQYLSYEELKTELAKNYSYISNTGQYRKEAKNHEDWPNDPQYFYCKKRADELKRQWPGTCKDGAKDPGWKDLLPGTVENPYLSYADLKKTLEDPEYSFITSIKKYYVESSLHSDWPYDADGVYCSQGQWPGDCTGATPASLDQGWFDLLYYRSHTISYRDLRSWLSNKHPSIATRQEYLKTRAGNPRYKGWPSKPWEAYCGNGWMGDCTGNVSDPGWDDFLPRRLGK
ncbi:MAG: DEAD/DEAH box helicase family protein [Bdellovibrionota bacterium]